MTYAVSNLPILPHTHQIGAWLPKFQFPVPVLLYLRAVSGQQNLLAHTQANSVRKCTPTPAALNQLLWPQCPGALSRIMLRHIYYTGYASFPALNFKLFKGETCLIAKISLLSFSSFSSFFYYYHCPNGVSWSHLRNK